MSQFDYLAIEVAECRVINKTYFTHDLTISRRMRFG